MGLMAAYLFATQAITSFPPPRRPGGRWAFLKPEPGRSFDGQGLAGRTRSLTWGSAPPEPEGGTLAAPQGSSVLQGGPILTPGRAAL